MSKWWLMATVVLALALPATSRAGTLGDLQFFLDGAGQGNTLDLLGPLSNEVLTLRFNASTGEGGGILNFSNLRITATGGLMIEPFNNPADCRLAAGCLVTDNELPGLIRFGSVGLILAEQTGVHDLAVLTISGLGTLQIESGEYTALDPIASFGVAPFTLASVTVVPEPGTLVLVGIGLGGLAVLRRRSG